MTEGVIYLLPMHLGSENMDWILPPEVKNTILALDHFIVENIKTSRRFLRKLDRSFDIDGSVFYELDKHDKNQDFESFFTPLNRGKNIGILSEAGIPSVADPGFKVIKEAQSLGYKIVPLVGPSSILMALSASGMNGQQFSFNGYLPIDKSDRTKQLKFLEKLALQRFTQIFMETPFRNNQLLDHIFSTCRPDTNLCIATNITLPNESIITLKINDWKKVKPNLNKQLCIFLLG